jgi:hypothetical protein
MAANRLFWLMGIFFLTSAISVVTGSTSLITVPAMLQFHIEPRTALATNMFALTFMCVARARQLQTWADSWCNHVFGGVFGGTVCYLHRQPMASPHLFDRCLGVGTESPDFRCMGKSSWFRSCLTQPIATMA